MSRPPGPDLRVGRPLWLSGTDHKQRYPLLRSRIETDVAIVGGGMTGALIAYLFAASGISVCLLEAELVARGSTAASSALLLHEPDESLSALRRHYGLARSRRIWQLSRQAVNDLVGLLKRLKIDCDLVEQDAVYYAANRPAADRLRTECSLRSQAGFKNRWLTSAALRRLTALTGHGGIRSTGNAQFNPYHACLGVLSAAGGLGAAIFERSRVARIDVLRDGVRLRTDSGSVDARSVLIATGYASKYFRPLAGRFRMFRTYVLATEPLNRDQRHELGLGQVMVWDADRPYHYVRWTRDHRLLLGGEDSLLRGGQRRSTQFAASTRRLREHFEAQFPTLVDVKTESAWEGLFAMTPDSLPYIGAHQRYPRHLFALGYGGNGMTFGFLAAQMLLEQWRGERSADHDLFAFGRLR